MSQTSVNNIDRSAVLSKMTFNDENALGSIGRNIESMRQNSSRQASGKNKILQIPINENINADNAFDQTEKDLSYKFLKLSDLFFVDNHKFKNESQYKGQMRQNKEKSRSERHGYGVNKWTNGAVYEGEWRNNQTNGKGTFWHSGGDIYIGEFLNDQAHGFGVYIHKNGSRYEGDWVHDVQQGQGEEIWIDGASYVGNYKDGMKHGYGIYHWADNSVFHGDWQLNKINGFGIYKWDDGRIYEG